MKKKKKNDKLEMIIKLDGNVIIFMRIKIFYIREAQRVRFFYNKRKRYRRTNLSFVLLLQYTLKNGFLHFIRHSCSKFKLSMNKIV